ncbi:MAG: hypothetical protein Q8K22_14975 [Rhodoferax sp.]|nr:hypothetical protein [Rhodoferax sp.]
MIKGASDRLILISPFLKLNDRMKELLTDKNRLKIDVRTQLTITETAIWHKLKKLSQVV